MDLELTDDQRRARDTAREVATGALLPGYAQRERAGRIEPALRRELGGLGLVAPELPAALGGRDADRVTTGLICEEIGRGDLTVAYLQVVGSLVGRILVANAPDLARRWVPRITAGEEVVGIGLTEPHGGSDAGMPRMTAVPDGGCWRLDGVKSLSFAADAAAAVVFARTDPASGRGEASRPSSCRSTPTVSPVRPSRTSAPPPSDAARCTWTASACRRRTSSAPRAGRSAR